jgi:hypothetical protein
MATPRRAIRYYVQYPDLQVERGRPVTLEEALAMLEEYPDDAVRSEFVMARHRGEEAAPPLLGFEDEGGAFLEMAWFPGRDYRLRVRAPRELRLPLGLRLRRWREAGAALGALGPVRQLLRLFFQGSFDRMWALLKGARR